VGERALLLQEERFATVQAKRACSVGIMGMDQLQELVTMESSSKSWSLLIPTSSTSSRAFTKAPLLGSASSRVCSSVLHLLLPITPSSARVWSSSHLCTNSLHSTKSLHCTTDHLPMCNFKRLPCLHPHTHTPCASLTSQAQRLHLDGMTATSQELLLGRQCRQPADVYGMPVADAYCMPTTRRCSTTAMPCMHTCVSMCLVFQSVRTPL